MHKLPFGVRISDSFITMLKEVTAKCRADWPGALPCLVVAEKCDGPPGDSRLPDARRINFDSENECEPINRIAQYTGPAPASQRFWAVCFDKRKYPPHMTFVLGGLEVHIDEQAQALLKGATLDFIDGKIVAQPEP